uniref:PmbA/TldA family metallopeptidase n=1 Tax=uncultured Sphingomonas sp. TaxID=158754 RepID=UPI00260B53EE
MLTVAEAQTRVHDLVAAARQAGADAADVLYVCNESTSVSVRLGELEDVERSEGETIGLRLFVGSRSASVSSSDLSGDALSTLVDRAVAMAREAPEDRWSGLAPVDRLLRGAAPDLDADDGADVAPEALRARAPVAE